MASSMNASLRQRIIVALSAVGQSGMIMGMTAGDVAKKLGAKKKEVNAELYQRMMPEGIVEQAYTGNPPLWRLRSPSNSSTTLPPDPSRPIPEPPRSGPDPPRPVPDPPRPVTNSPVLSVSTPDPPIISSVLSVNPRLLPDPLVSSRPQPASVSNTQEPECSVTTGDGRSQPLGSGVPYLGDKENSQSESVTLDADILQALKQSAEPLNVPDVKKENAGHVDQSETETLEASILRVLRQSAEPLSALNIAKRVGKESAGQVNPALYKLKSTCHVQSKQLPGESKPLWFANPNLQTPSHVCIGSSAYPTPLEAMTPSKETGNFPKLYSREDHDDGQIVFTPHKTDSNSSLTQEGDQSELPGARKPKRGKPRVGIAAIFPSREDDVLEEEEDKEHILELLGRRPASQRLETSKISEELGHPTRKRAMIALTKLKKEGKVSDDLINGISFWSLKL